MCENKPCDNCCHEEDLICCMPMMHCCGGYSEHNNCCPHNRCCNHPCCCDDGCPFTPECCCCKALKCCKKNKEKIEAIESTINSIESTIIRDEQKHDSDISNINHTIEDISNVIQQIIEDAITDISYNNTTKYITYKTKNGSPVNVVKVAPLDNANKIPSEYLPSYVDDVIEGYYSTSTNNFYYDQNHTNPITGEDGKIYVDITDGGNNTYRYTGSTYIEVSPTKFGEVAGTAYEGNKGKALSDAVYNHTNDTSSHVSQIDRGTWNNKYTKPLNGIPKSDLAQDVRESLSKADNALQAHQNIKSLSTASSSPLTPQASEPIVGTGSIQLHQISKTGNWDDLLNKPLWIGPDKPTYNLDEIGDGDTRKLSNYALVSHTHTKSEITDFPTNVSSFTNDAGYITSSDIPADYVKKVKVGQSGTELAPDNNGVVTLPEYPTASSINITIGGDSYNLQTLLTNITNDITALKDLWRKTTDGGYTYLEPVTSTNRVRGYGFYDTTVS